MQKLQKAVRALREIIRQPALLNHILNSDEVRKQNVIRKYQRPQGLPTVDFREITGTDSFTLKTFAFLDGSSLATDLGLLKLLAGQFDDCRYFEIGTWRGESVVNVAENAPRASTLNLSAKEMTQMGLPQIYADLHGFFSRKNPAITHLEGNSAHYDFAGMKQKFDLIFIDGDHHYEAVKRDTENIFQHLIHPETVVVWHDYAYNPEHVRFEVLEAILDGTPARFHSRLYHVSNTMCAVYYPHKELPGHFAEYPTVPNKQFEINVKIKPLS